MTEAEPTLSEEIVTGELPLTGYQYFHSKEGLNPDYVGDGIIELPDRTVLIFDVSLGAHTFGEVGGKQNVVITEALVAETLRKYLEENFSEGLSVKEVVELCAQFLKKEIIGRLGIDMGLSATACRRENDSFSIASFGSNWVLGPNGEVLIKPRKAHDPHLSRHTGGGYEETPAMTEKLEIRTKKGSAKGFLRDGD